MSAARGRRQAGRGCDKGAAAGIERARRDAAKAMRAFLDARGEGVEWFAARVRVDVTHATALLNGIVAPSVPEAERIAALLGGG